MSRFLHLLLFTLLAFSARATVVDEPITTLPLIDVNDDNLLRFPDASPEPLEPTQSTVPLDLLPPHAVVSQQELDESVVRPIASTSSNSSSHHTFHTTQSTNTWTFELMCAQAPWSPRIQPALLYQQKEITYRRWSDGLQVSTGDDWLLFYEGSLSFITVAGNNTEANENDVWASMDDGQTWDLVAGVTRRGTTGLHSAWGGQASSFQPRGGSNNCEDPASDDIYSIGGYRYFGLGTNIYSTSVIWTSTDAKRWQFANNVFSPSRYFSSCDVDINGHVYAMGGLHVIEGTQNEELLNDVWTTAQGGFTLATARAGWSPRAEHLTLIASDTPLNREIIYVIGGWTTYETRNGQLYQVQANDVHASSDQGVTWWQITAAAPFFRRWGHGGVVNKDGVLIVFGGSNTDTGYYADMYSYRDVWASFDGGISWNNCRLPDGPDEARQFIRTEQGVTLDSRGRMIIASGYSYDGRGGRFLYQDVWRTPFSVDDTATLATMCGGPGVIPRAGPGLRRWAANTQLPTPTNSFVMYPQTHRAPWSQRIQPAFLLMHNPVTYTQVGTGVKRSTGVDWLLMYEGSLTYSTQGVATNENDVWASLDMGATWDLIAGISRNGTRGYVEAVNATDSFSSRGGSNNCEDPTNDDVFSIGGISYIPGTTQSTGAVNEVWYSTDAITWRLQTGGASQSYSPGRYFSSCDVDDHGVMYVLGGVVPGVNGQANKLLNDVWQGRYKGREWTRVDDQELDKWSPRAEHQVLQWHSPTFKKDIIYVMGGMVRYDTRAGQDNTQTINDVWATSDGGVTWALLAGPDVDMDQTMWSKRWGHAAVITEAGVIIVSGGTDSPNGRAAQQVTKKDMWLSWDGGYTWQQCKLCPSNQQTCNPDFVRTEQAAQLTSDEYLLLSTGYTHYNGSRRIGYSDVWRSAFSLADHDALARVCGGTEFIPEAGVGLRRWPGQAPVSSTKAGYGMSGAAIAGIVFAILIVVAVSGFCLNAYKKTGQFPLPAFLGGSSSSSGGSGGETSTTDYSAFAFASDNKDGPASTNGTNGTNGATEHNSQFLS